MSAKPAHSRQHVSSKRKVATLRTQELAIILVQSRTVKARVESNDESERDAATSPPEALRRIKDLAYKPLATI
jgi:hypothetical protein